MQDQDFTEHPLFERQVALEAEMVSRGAEVFKRQEADAKARQLESATRGGAYLVRRAIKPVADGIRAFLNTAASGAPGKRHVSVAYLRQVPPDTAAFLALRTALNMLSSRNSLQNLALAVGAAVETEARLAAFEDADKQAYERVGELVGQSRHERYRRIVYTYLAGKNQIDMPAWPKPAKLQIGQKLIEIIIDSTGYLEITQERKKPKGKATDAIYHVMGSKKCLEWIRRLDTFGELATPEYLPTIIPPRPWTNPYEGGYYTVYKPLRLVKATHPHHLAELALLNDEMATLYNGINAMQSTGYSVNKAVLDIMRRLWEAGGDVAGIPHRENYALPRCPFCGAEIPPLQKPLGGRRKHPCFTREENREALKAWKREAAAIHENNVITMSRRFLFAKTLWLADKFKDESAIYFPMQLDFRGRCYAVPSYLNPQGADFAKGLLLFAAARPINTPEAELWLAVHGANTWGNDKVSLEERRQWVRRNESEILAIAADPLEHREMWFGADKPWQFLAFCFEWAGYKREGPGFMSRLPVAMDGSCNGLQIFSLMLRDPVGGAATNLLPSERPQDIYQIVADKTKSKLEEKLVSGGPVYRKNSTEEIWYDEKDMARRLLAFGIDRKTTKRQVMVLPYGGTTRSCLEYTLAHLDERLRECPPKDDACIHRKIVFQAAHFLAGLIWRAMGETVVAARQAMTFLQQLARVAASEGLPITWVTPVGFPVSQAYRDFRPYRVKTRLGASVVRLMLKDEGESAGIDQRRQRNGISPNFVHSLDAAAMFQSIHLARKEGVSAFMMVHDSYGTHAADAATLARCLREAFVDMFTRRDVLADLKKEVQTMLPEAKRKLLPELPPKGDLDVRKVLESAFFFA
jgi:DNA-directed RNA polymerase